jgi:hypothetical protein
MGGGPLSVVVKDNLQDFLDDIGEGLWIDVVTIGVRRRQRNERPGDEL